MVFRRVWAALCWVKDYLHDLLQVCRGFEPCVHEDCENFVHLDDPTFPECWNCYREHSAQGLTDYVMGQIQLLDADQHETMVATPTLDSDDETLRRR